MEHPASESPDVIRFDHRPTGIRRLNRLPLIIGIGVAAAVVTLFSYAIYQRSQPVSPGMGEEGPKRNADTMSAARITRPHQGAEIPAALSIPRQEPAVNEKQLTTDKTGSEERAADRPVLLERQPSQQRRSPVDTKRQMPTLKRLQQKYLAMQASIDVPFDKRSTGNNQSSGSTNLRRPYSPLANGTPTSGTLFGRNEDDPNMQAKKEAFFQREIPATPVIHGRDHPASPAEIRSGTVIPAVMITGINSDLPGMIKAQVSQNVYDTATGRHLVIPQGSMLIGAYDSKVAFGQNRVLVAWNRLVFPDASTVELGNMPGNDISGYAGLADDVDNHYFRIFGSALLTSLISAGYAISTADEDKSDDEITIQNEVARSMTKATDQILRKNLNIQPTITVRPGLKFNVFVNKDITFPNPFDG
ncbi:MAG: TrbI/VirB10 family protein [Sedimenticola sp.]